MVHISIVSWRYKIVVIASHIICGMQHIPGIMRYALYLLRGISICTTEYYVKYNCYKKVFDWLNSHIT